MPKIQLKTSKITMKKEIKKRSAYLQIGRAALGIPIPLGKRPVWITGYNKSEKFVCRLEISAPGIAVFKGAKGKTKLGNWTWEKFVKELESGQE
jgi:hypothetical protein